MVQWGNQLQRTSQLLSLLLLGGVCDVCVATAFNFFLIYLPVWQVCDLPEAADMPKSRFRET